MSVAMLTTVSINMYMLSGSAPATPATPGTDSAVPRARPARQVEHEDGDRGRFRENSLVSAIMSAFQALGIGGPTASPQTSSTTAAASGTTTTPVVDTKTGTATTVADAKPAPDTLEKAVNEFAHALSGLLNRPDRSATAANESGGAKVHNHEGHGRAGYRGLAQRLEQLAQSLGAASASTPTPTPTPTDAPAPATVGTVVTTTEPSTTTTTTSVSSARANDTNRLLAAFAKVVSFLQPPATTTDSSPGTPVDTAVSNTSTADKLKQFLTTLAQSLQSAGHATLLTPVGSRVDLTA